jgi:hypothetical protein
VSAAVVNRLHPGHEPNDCAMCALACYLGRDYTDVLRAATLTDRRARGRKGLWTRTIVRVGKALGVTLRKRRVDPEDGYALILAPDHAAVLRAGLVIDRDMIWPLDAWMADRKITLDECEFLTVVGE